MPSVHACVCPYRPIISVLWFSVQHPLPPLSSHEVPLMRCCAQLQHLSPICERAHGKKKIIALSVLELRNCVSYKRGPAIVLIIKIKMCRGGAAYKGNKRQSCCCCCAQTVGGGIPTEPPSAPSCSSLGFLPVKHLL